VIKNQPNLLRKYFLYPFNATPPRKSSNGKSQNSYVTIGVLDNETNL